MLGTNSIRFNRRAHRILYAPFTFFLFVILAPAEINAQGLRVTHLNVSDCYSDKLVTHASESTMVQYKYFYLSLINSENYDKAQKEASVLGVFPGGLFDGSYKEFAEHRSNYFKFNNESLDYYYSQQSNISYLPSEWKDTIQGCIRDTLNAAKFGLTYFPVDVDPKKFRLELKYVSTEKTASSPYVKSSEITGGYVIYKGKVQRSLYPECEGSRLSTCAKLDSRNEFMVIRDNPNETVSVTLNLSNEPQSAGFDVNPVPKKVHCDNDYSTAELSKEYGPYSANDNVTGYTYGSDPNEVAIWKKRLIAPGKVTYVEVKFPMPGWAFMPNLGKPTVANRIKQVGGLEFNRSMTKDPDWEDDTVWILGFKNGGDVRKFSVIVNYKEPAFKCTEIDWPIPAKQANAK